MIDIAPLLDTGFDTTGDEPDNMALDDIKPDKDEYDDIGDEEPLDDLMSDVLYVESTTE